MNSQPIINLPEPVDPTSPLRRMDAPDVSDVGDILNDAMELLGSSQTLLTQSQTTLDSIVEATADLVDIADDVALKDMSNISNTTLTDKVRTAERSRGAGFYDTIWLTSNEIDLTDTTDMTATLQSFIDTAQAAGKKLVGPKRRGGGNINISAPLVFQHGRSAGSGDQKEVFFDLNGVSLAPRHAGYAIEIDPICTVDNAAANPGHGVARLNISNVYVALYANSAAKAIRLGRQGRVMDDFDHMTIENMLVTHANTDGVITIEGVSRHFKLNSVITRGLGGLLVHANTANGFCGDIEAVSCEFSGSASKRPLIYRVSASGAQIRGIDLRADVYGAGSLIDVQTGQAGDLWFTNVQWDGPINDVLPAVDEAALQVYVGNGAMLFDTFLNTNYFKSIQGRAIVASQVGTGVCRNFQVNGGIIENTSDGTSATNGTVYFKDIGGLRMRGMLLRDIDSPAAINMDNSDDWVIDGCALERRLLGTANTNMIVATNGCDRYTVTNNVANVASGLDSDVFNDASTAGAAYIVENNISDSMSGANAVSPVIPSATVPVLPRHGNQFFISGTTSFGQLAGGRKGRRVTLIFQGTLSVFSSNAGGFNDMRLANNATFSAAADRTLELEHNGIQWVQVGGVS